MICEECKNQGLKSRVHEEYTSKSLMFNQVYYDEEGKHHHHDMNTLTTYYACSNGHNFVKKQKPVWLCCPERSPHIL